MKYSIEDNIKNMKYSIEEISEIICNIADIKNNDMEDRITKILYDWRDSMADCCVKIDKNEYNKLYDANGGICIYCKELVLGCGGYTRGHKCPKCGNDTVYNIEEASLRGYINI